MHILDLIMYIVLAIILWRLMDKIWDGEYTEELGGVGGLFFEFIFTLIYIIIFGVFDNDWIDIFKGVNTLGLLNITW